MTTFRKFCCNDLLDITPILMDQFSTAKHNKTLDQRSLSWYLTCIAEFCDYFIVATSPGERIMGYCTAIIEEDDTMTKRCNITHIAVYDRYYLSAALARLFVEAVDETSELIDEVDCLSILPSTNLRHISLKEMLEGTGFENHIENQTEDMI
ncbi:hypothetical protein MKW94_015356 [Papaver nudicaule]|uniref:N-acetyltransferase domain-containing protein n=1 Tax=Papaver nudicaule TaxID=74823 RepID=A0AA41SGG0_PAPNU|nr:hypothetical protein [Papaver nudicaule]